MGLKMGLWMVLAMAAVVCAAADNIESPPYTVVHVESDFTVPAAPLARPLSASYIDDNQN